MTETVWLSLGSNMGDRQYYLRQAIARLAAHPLIEVAAVSSLYETDPWGVSGQDDYFNIAAGVVTQLEPEDLLDYTQRIEQEMGRRRTVRWGPRQLDIDLILFGGRQLDTPRLQIPHPRFRERMFVLRPLYEIAGDLLLPDGERLSAALDKCAPDQRVDLIAAAEQWLGEIADEDN